MVGITSTKVNWILDADIRSFFDTVSQEWLIKFVEHRIGDRRIIRLIQKWLKAGVLEDGIVTVSDKGTGQGSVISPLLANIYLHYVFDLWAERWRRREAAGNMIIVRYADDLIVGFEHETDARRFLDEMRERLQEFALSLHSEKTRLIEFGRFAADKPQAARARQTGDLHLPGLHLYLRQNSSGQIPNQTEDPAGSHAGKAASDQTGTATAHASADSEAGKMAAAGRHRLLQLPRGADKQFDTDGVPIPRHRSLAAHATAAGPERPDDLGADQRLADDWLPTPRILHPWPASASPSNTQGGSRMPELGTYGSVRGALSNERPYRESLGHAKPTRLTPTDIRTLQPATRSRPLCMH